MVAAGGTAHGTGPLAAVGAAGCSFAERGGEGPRRMPPGHLPSVPNPHPGTVLPAPPAAWLCQRGPAASSVGSPRPEGSWPRSVHGRDGPRLSHTCTAAGAAPSETLRPRSRQSQRAAAAGTARPPLDVTPGGPLATWAPVRILRVLAVRCAWRGAGSRVRHRRPVPLLPWRPVLFAFSRIECGALPCADEQPAAVSGRGRDASGARVREGAHGPCERPVL